MGTPRLLIATVTALLLVTLLPPRVMLMAAGKSADHSILAPPVAQAALAGSPLQTYTARVLAPVTTLMPAAAAVLGAASGLRSAKALARP